jgi:hypothetical protein
MWIADMSAESAKDSMAGVAIRTITARGQDQTGSEQYECVQTLTASRWRPNAGVRDFESTTPAWGHGSRSEAVHANVRQDG